MRIYTLTKGKIASCYDNIIKGRGHRKIYSEFIVQVFSLGGMKTHDIIFKIFGIR